MQQQFLQVIQDISPQTESQKSGSMTSNIDTTNRNPLSKAFWSTPESPKIIANFPKSEISDNGKDSTTKREATRQEKPSHLTLSPQKTNRRKLTQIGDSSKERVNSRKNTSKIINKEPKKPSPPKYKVPRGISPMKHQQLLIFLDSIVTKQKKPKKLKEIVRRKSCVCQWCGGESEKEKKWCHIVLKDETKQPEKILHIPLKRKKNQNKTRPSFEITNLNNSIDLDMTSKHRTVIRRVSGNPETPLVNSSSAPRVSAFQAAADAIVQQQPAEIKIVAERRKMSTSLKKSATEERSPVKMPAIYSKKLNRASTTSSSNQSSVLYVGNKVMDLRCKPTSFTPIKLQLQQQHDSRARNRVFSPPHCAMPFESKLLKPEVISKSPDLSLSKTRDVQAPYIEYSQAIKAGKAMPKALSMLKRLSEAQAPLNMWSASSSLLSKPIRSDGIRSIGSSSVKSSMYFKEKDSFMDLEGSKMKFVTSGVSFFKHYHHQSVNNSMMFPHRKSNMEDTVDRLELIEDQENNSIGVKNRWNNRTALSPDVDKLEEFGLKKVVSEEKVTFSDGYKLAKKVYNRNNGKKKGI